MKYSEAMEYTRLLNFDPEIAYPESFKRAIAAEEAFQNQMAFESTMGSFVDDVDSLRDENIEIATEAANAVGDTLKKIWNWFKNLLTRFKQMIRKIVFKSRVKKNEKMAKKIGSKYDINKGTGPIKNSADIELSDEEYEKYNKIFIALSDNGMGIGSLSKTMSAVDLAKLSKRIASLGDEYEKKLSDAMKNPSPDTSVKTLNTACKQVAQAMKVVTTLLNKAVKNGTVQNKDGEPAEKVSDSDVEVTDKNGNPVK